jgi:hypothetical protein
MKNVFLILSLVVLSSSLFASEDITSRHQASEKFGFGFDFDFDWGNDNDHRRGYRRQEWRCVARGDDGAEFNWQTDWNWYHWGYDADYYYGRDWTRQDSMDEATASCAIDFDQCEVRCRRAWGVYYPPHNDDGSGHHDPN